MRALVAVDLFDEPMDTVLRAVKWAQTMDARLDIVYADEHALQADFIADDALREMVFREWDDYRIRFRTQLDMLILKVPRELRGQTIVRKGPPADVVCSVAEGDYDVLMVSTNQRKGLSRLVMGSVAEKIVRRATVPVLVLHG